MDLTQEVPLQLKSLDPHAARRWPVFLRKAGLKMTRNGWNDPHRAFIVVSFGIPSLLRRLAHATTEVERARIWWRESAACAAGESISDLSDENRYVLNPFICEGPKFRNARIEAMKAAKAGSEPAPAGDRTCLACGADISPLRAGARYCSRACKVRAMRSRQNPDKSGTGVLAA